VPAIEHITIKGPVSVAYTKADGEWYATALQFDIMGAGRTRDEAFQDLQKCVEIFLHSVLETSGNVAFFNPSEQEEWNNPDQEQYKIGVTTRIAKPSI